MMRAAGELFLLRRSGDAPVASAALLPPTKMQSWVVICWAVLVLVGADECPDGGRCKEGQTCCSSPTADGYRCCPFDQAECCEDHIHCCPAGTVCNAATSSCVNATVSVPWAERTSADQTKNFKSFRMIKTSMDKDYDTICPDKSRCPAEFSCVKGLTKFGCCPVAKGVSCSDGKHCCPEGHHCSIDSRSCIKKVEIPCNGTAACRNGTTCCKNKEGDWTCCPHHKAVCCKDLKHCCPHGTKCNLDKRRCEGESTSVPWAEKIPTIPREDVQVEVKDVVCNSSTKCPDESTCCKNAQGDWACCPIPNAVCCDDHIHCCPNGLKCNLAAMTCDEGLFSQPLVKKIPTIPRKDVQVEVKVVPCNSTAGCPDGSTCCKTQQGDWSCCPLPKAACCADNKHCCPAGSKCDLSTLTCRKASGSTPMMQKIPAFTFEADSADETPTQNQVTTAEIVESEEISSHEEDDDDDDDNDDDDNDDDDYDGEEEEEEDDSEEEIPDIKNRTKCDNHTSCPHRTTCCFITSSKKWSCCPLRKAVCCADGVHCCPARHKCKEDKASCTRDDVVIPWYTKIPATTSDQADPSSVKCDNKTECPRHTSCCKLSAGKWGCCPVKKAVCCHDKKHCCPRGYACDSDSKSCKKEGMLETVPLTPVYLPENQLQLDPLQQKVVKCDDQYSCPDGMTCCHTSPTSWGCCPIPNAVCCSDFKHCCPAGTTCSGGGCSQNEKPNWYNWNSFFANKKKVQIL